MSRRMLLQKPKYEKNSTGTLHSAAWKIEQRAHGMSEVCGGPDKWLRPSSSSPTISNRYPGDTAPVRR